MAHFSENLPPCSDFILERKTSRSSLLVKVNATNLTPSDTLKHLTDLLQEFRHISAYVAAREEEGDGEGCFKKQTNTKTKQNNRMRHTIQAL